MVTGIKPIEHFKELVSDAMQRQKVITGEMAEYYLSSLLASFTTSEKSIDEPLAIAYLKALGCARDVQLRQMRAIGDISLFTSGFFSDSLKRKVVDIDYYIAMGSSCYSYVASIDRNGETRRLFTELAARFPAFVDVLNEVSERSRLTSSKDVLRIYERWLRTKSKIAEKALRDMGIEPYDAGTKPVH
jgi:hypothetical protein